MQNNWNRQLSLTKANLAKKANKEARRLILRDWVTNQDEEKTLINLDRDDLLSYIED